MAMNTSKAATSDKQLQDIDDWLPITSSRNAKWWYSAFHNVTAMVGAGVLSLPYAMSELGWYIHTVGNGITFNSIGIHIMYYYFVHVVGFTDV